MCSFVLNKRIRCCGHIATTINIVHFIASVDFSSTIGHFFPLLRSCLVKANVLQANCLECLAFAQC